MLKKMYTSLKWDEMRWDGKWDEMVDCETEMVDKMRWDGRLMMVRWDWWW